MKVFFPLFALITAIPAAAAPPAFDEAVSAYETELSKEGVVGGNVTLIARSGVVASHDFGSMDVDAQRPVAPDTIFHWASVTKVFTSIVAMQLVERGELSLDDPVTKYVPELRQAHNPFGSIDDVTIRHLLTHSSGLRGASWPWNADGAEDRTDWQPHEPTRWSQIEALMPYTGLAFKPGSKSDYSNLGMLILGEVITRITGEDIEIRIDKEILKPLEMTQSYFDATPWLARSRRTHDYTFRDGKRQDNGAELDSGITAANGGLNGPASDMAKFVAFLIGDPRAYPILKHRTLEAMLEPQLPFAEEGRRKLWIGLGFFIVDEKGADGVTRRYFGHSGFQRGNRSALYIARDGCCAFTFNANTVTRGGNPSATALRIAMVDKVFPTIRKGKRK